MSPQKRKKLSKIRYELDKLDNSLIKIIKKRTNLVKKVQFLLKEQGMTINGVKKILSNNEPLKLDEMSNHSIRANNLKNKLVKISKLIKDLKDNK